MGTIAKVSEPRVPEGVTPTDVGAPVVRDEGSGEQLYPEQFGGQGPDARDPENSDGEEGDGDLGDEVGSP